jgi:hypothetical protein
MRMLGGEHEDAGRGASNWKPTDVRLPPYAGGWLVTGWDFDRTEYGRKATIEEWKAAMEGT